jgi:hypothetical protein
MTSSSDQPGTPQEPTEAADTYHDPGSALKWALRLETVAWLPLFVAVLAFVILASELYLYLPQVIKAGAFEAWLSVSIPVLIPLTAAVVSASLFVLLRAASQAFLLLLDIKEK